jgi:Transcription factor WhiB
MWQDQAACNGAGDSNYAFGDDSSGRPENPWKVIEGQRWFIRNYCDHCPVVEECLTLGLSEQYGVWGGLLPSERRRLAVQLQSVVDH